MRKQRLTVTVDPDVVDAGHRAVEAGAADSLSGWVNAALDDRVRRDQKLEQLAAAVADFEREFGEITADEIADQRRSDRDDATVVRGAAGGAMRSARSA